MYTHNYYITLLLLRAAGETSDSRYIEIIDKTRVFRIFHDQNIHALLQIQRTKNNNRL